MGRGIPAYNCAINKEKGGANFKLDENRQVSVDEEGSTPVLINIIYSIPGADPALITGRGPNTFRLKLVNFIKILMIDFT